jgi:hypothetical protein
MARHTSPAQIETPIPNAANASTMSEESSTGEKPERGGVSGALAGTGRGRFIVYKHT